MAGRIQKQPLIASVILLWLLAFAVHADTTLVSYNFDYDVLDSGPDTYQIFQHSHAKAEISTAYAAGGYASAHLVDAAGDGDFVEFQGYFPEQSSGLLHFQFKFFIANQHNQFNVALVGKDRYQLSPQGINFWLYYEDGWLRHKSDSIPKKLFQPNLYEWYTADAVLDISMGSYALQFLDERGQVVLALQSQVFASGAAKQYSFKEFSFVGDLADSRDTDIYIDDVSLTTSRNMQLPALVAPGRRKYFIEMWDEYHHDLQGKLQCMPAKNLEDFGIYPNDYEVLENSNQLEALQELTRAKPHISKKGKWKDSAELSAIVDWLNACDALDRKQIPQAKKWIAAALEKKPTAYIYQLSRLIIDSSTSQDLNALYSQAYNLPRQDDDMRLAIVLAMIAFNLQPIPDGNNQVSPHIDAALASLDQLKEEDLKQLQQSGIKAIHADYISRLQRYMPQDWENHLKWLLILEQQYYAYLWQGDYNNAYSLAKTITDKLTTLNVAASVWVEREADAAFLLEDFSTALSLYGQQAGISQSSLLKMADIYHMQDDLTNEKRVRESIYRNFSRNE